MNRKTYEDRPWPMRSRGLQVSWVGGDNACEEGNKVAHEGAKQVLWPFVEKVPKVGDHEEGPYVEVEHEEDVLETF